MARHGNSSFCGLDAQTNEHHQTLFKLLDRITTQLIKTGLDDLERRLERLPGCTRHHFAHEEGLMSEAGFPGFLFRHKQYQSSSPTTRKALGPVAMGLMISPVKIARRKEAHTFHFKRDDLPFL